MSHNDWYREAAKLHEDNARLQKQVDRLTEALQRICNEVDYTKAPLRAATIAAHVLEQEKGE